MSSSGSGVTKTVAHDTIMTTATPTISTRIIGRKSTPSGLWFVKSAKLRCKTWIGTITKTLECWRPQRVLNSSLPPGGAIRSMIVWPPGVESTTSVKAFSQNP
jgi:hypothetical protein